jgi:DNA-binding winged helix-turn-helix (wHTH) protein/predicted ATPase
MADEGFEAILRSLVEIALKQDRINADVRAFGAEVRMSPLSFWSFPPFRLDPGTRSLWRDDALVPLPPKPLAVLAVLVAQAGQVVTKEALLDAVWPDTTVTEGVLKGCIAQIRRVLGAEGTQAQYIATVHGRGYRFIAPVTLLLAPEDPSVPPGALPSMPVRAGTPPLLVGREAELAQLHQWWGQARQGTRQVVFVTGEAGIGKTTLVDAFVAQMAPTVPVWIGRGQCLEQHGAGEPYLPLLEALGRLGRGPDGSQLVSVLRQQAPSWLLQLPALVPEDDYAALQRRGGGVTRERMLRELAEAVEAVTATRPVVLVLEDLHWSDAATVDWLAYVARRREAARLLVLGTYRPTEALVQGHPVHKTAQDLQLHGQGRALVLGYFSAAAVAAYLAQRLGTPQLPAALARVLHQRTTGNPLFLVTVVDEFVRRGVLRESATGWVLTDTLEAVTDEVPASLRHLIEQQFERLPPDDQDLLEAASVVGVEFAAAAVAAAVDRPLEDVERRCTALARRGQFIRSWGSDTWPDGTLAARHAFQHALYQEGLYTRLPVGMRRRLHQQIGARLEAGYGARAREIAVVLAAHFVRGHDPGRAVPYLEVAGTQAMERSAYLEAISHFTTGIELLQTLPETPEHTQQALTLHIALGAALLVTKGQAAPEVEHAYTQARALCQQVDETPELVPVLFGLWRFYIARPQFQLTREIGETLLRLAQHAHDPALFVIAHYALGTTWWWLGALPVARTHLEEAIARYTPDQRRAPVLRIGHDPGVACRAWAAIILWCLGYSDQALARLHDTLTLAHELSHPYSLAWAQVMAALVSQMRRDVSAVHAQAEAAVAFATEQGFPLWVALGTSLRGWALAMQGQSEVGMAQVRQGIAAVRATGQALFVPFLCTLLAEVSAHLGHPEDSLQALAEAHTLVGQHEERWWEAEVYRLRGVLLLRQPGTPQEEAETWLQRALDVARRQEAKALELRAAMSLSRLWQQQDKQAAARALLAPVYTWFTEGFDTADLQEAKALLHTLGKR